MQSTKKGYLVVTSLLVLYNILSVFSFISKEEYEMFMADPTNDPKSKAYIKQLWKNEVKKRGDPNPKATARLIAKLQAEEGFIIDPEEEALSEQYIKELKAQEAEQLRILEEQERASLAFAKVLQKELGDEDDDGDDINDDDCRLPRQPEEITPELRAQLEEFQRQFNEEDDNPSTMTEEELTELARSFYYQDIGDSAGGNFYRKDGMEGIASDDNYAGSSHGIGQCGKYDDDDDEHNHGVNYDYSDGDYDYVSNTENNETVAKSPPSGGSISPAGRTKGPAKMKPKVNMLINPSAAENEINDILKKITSGENLYVFLMHDQTMLPNCLYDPGKLFSPMETYTMVMEEEDEKGNSLWNVYYVVGEIAPEDHREEGAEYATRLWHNLRNAGNKTGAYRRIDEFANQEVLCVNARAHFHYTSEETEDWPKKKPPFLLSFTLDEPDGCHGNETKLPSKVSELSKTAAYMLYSGSFFIWFGKFSSLNVQVHAARRVELFMDQKGIDPFTPVTYMMQGSETPDFLSNFSE